MTAVGQISEKEICPRSTPRRGQPPSHLRHCCLLRKNKDNTLTKTSPCGRPRCTLASLGEYNSNFTVRSLHFALLNALMFCGT